MSAKSAPTVPREASGVDANKNTGVPAPKHVAPGAPPGGGGAVSGSVDRGVHSSVKRMPRVSCGFACLRWRLSVFLLWS